MLRGLLLCFLFSTPLVAAPPTSITGLNQARINIGAGWMGGPEFTGMGVSISVNYYVSRYVLSARLIDDADTFYYPAVPGGSPSIRDLNDISVMAGCIRKNKWIYGSVAAGFGIVNDNRRVAFQGRSFTTVDIRFESQVFLTPFEVMGIGIILVGNVNAEASYIGGLLGIQFGILR